MEPLTGFETSALALIAEHPNENFPQVGKLMGKMGNRARGIAQEILRLAAERSHAVERAATTETQTARAFLAWAEENRTYRVVETAKPKPQRGPLQSFSAFSPRVWGWFGGMTMEALERQNDILRGRVGALETEIARLRARWYGLLDVCEEFACLADDAEAIPYPLRVRFRRACQAAGAAIAAAKQAQ